MICEKRQNLDAAPAVIDRVVLGTLEVEVERLPRNHASRGR